MTYVCFYEGAAMADIRSAREKQTSLNYLQKAEENKQQYDAKSPAFLQQLKDWSEMSRSTSDIVADIMSSKENKRKRKIKINTDDNVQ